MLRLVGVLHLAAGGVELLEASELNLGAKIRPRDLCTLLSKCNDMAHKEGRYRATSNDPAGIAHTIGAEAVALAKLLLVEHMNVRSTT